MVENHSEHSVCENRAGVYGNINIASGNDDNNGNGNGIGGNNSSNNIGVIAERAKPKLKKPPMYKVLLLNDDFTPMEFVVILLMRFFNMTQEKAEQIMIHIHTRGQGVCGVFPREIAELKVQQIMQCAHDSEHPLQCTMEED